MLRGLVTELSRDVGKTSRNMTFHRLTLRVVNREKYHRLDRQKRQLKKKSTKIV